MTSVASEASIRRRNKQLEADHQAELSVIGDIMKTVQGRKWLWSILADAQIFVEDETLDPQWLAFCKGRRRSGLRLLKAAQTFGPLYIRMIEENTNRKVDPEDDDRSSPDE